MNIREITITDRIKDLHVRNVALHKQITNNQEKIQKLWDKLEQSKTKPKGVWKGEGIPQSILEKLRKIV